MSSVALRPTAGAGTAVIRFLLAVGVTDVVISVPAEVLHPSMAPLIRRCRSSSR